MAPRGAVRSGRALLLPKDERTSRPTSWIRHAPSPRVPDCLLAEDPRLSFEAVRRSVSHRPRWLRKRERGTVHARVGPASQELSEREDGPTAVEYAVMLALIIVVCLAAIGTLGNNANATFSNVALNVAASGS